MEECYGGACNFTKSDTPPGVFLTFEIVQKVPGRETHHIVYYIKCTPSNLESSCWHSWRCGIFYVFFWVCDS